MIESQWSYAGHRRPLIPANGHILAPSRQETTNVAGEMSLADGGSLKFDDLSGICKVFNCRFNGFAVIQCKELT